MPCPISEAFRETIRDKGPVTDARRAAVQAYFDHVEGCPPCKAEDDEIMKDYDDATFDAALTQAFGGRGGASHEL